MAEALSGLPLPPLRLRVNNRKLIEGFYRGLGAKDPAAVITVIDKLDKLPRDAVRDLLTGDAGLTDEQADLCLSLADIETTDASFAEQVRALGVKDDLLDTGIAELSSVIDGCASAEHRAIPGGREPQPGPRARLLHGHGLRDLHGRLREPQVGRGWRPLRRARLRRKDDLPGGGHLLRHLADRLPLSTAACSAPTGPSPRPCWSPCRTRTPVRPPTRSPSGCAPAACPPRWPRPRRSSASRSGTPNGAACPTCGSPAPTGPPTRSRTSAAATRSTPTRHLDASRRGPAPPRGLDLPPRPKRLPPHHKEQHP